MKLGEEKTLRQGQGREGEKRDMTGKVGTEIVTHIEKGEKTEAWKSEETLMNMTRREDWGAEGMMGKNRGKKKKGKTGKGGMTARTDVKMN